MCSYVLFALVTRKDVSIRPLEVRIKAIELEWENAYEQLMKLAGRADKGKAQALLTNRATAPVEPTLTPTEQRQAILKGIQ